MTTIIKSSTDKAGRIEETEQKELDFKKKQYNRWYCIHRQFDRQHEQMKFDCCVAGSNFP